MNLNDLLSLKRLLFSIDCESTGLNPDTDRIVELAFERWESEGMTLEWRSLIKIDSPMPKSAERVHKITNESLLACRACGGANPIILSGDRCRCEEFKPWPYFAQVAERLAKLLSDCDFAGKNVRFDLRFLAAEFARAKVEWDYSKARVIDADRLEALGDPRSLTHLVKKHLGESMGGDAHTALGDVQWTSKLIGAQLKTYGSLPRDLDLLHTAQWGEMLDTEGKFKMIDGVATCMFGKHRNKAMKDIPRDYWDWLLKADFPADVKALASAAKLGQFPTETK